MTTSIYNRTQNFLNKAKLIHNNKYDYSLVDYRNNKTIIRIICPIHGIFEQTPHQHKISNGCSKCSYNQMTGGYNLTSLQRNSKLANQNATLYFIQYDNLHKIGITTNNITRRFYKSIKIISQLTNITLFEAFNKEQEILEHYSKFKEKPKNWNYGGDTEFINISNDQRDEIINNISAYGIAKGKVSC